MFVCLLVYQTAEQHHILTVLPMYPGVAFRPCCLFGVFCSQLLGGISRIFWPGSTHVALARVALELALEPLDSVPWMQVNASHTSCNKPARKQG